jgi:hypothetical protein
VVGVEYRCADCTHTDAGDLATFAESMSSMAHGACGWTSPAWWIPGVPWPILQAEIVTFLFTHGRCGRHASVLAELAIDVMRRRCYGEAFPGTVRVTAGDLRTPPYDEIGGLDEAEEIAKYMRGILAGTKVGAHLAVDRERARMRCTFILVDAVGVVEVSLPAARIRRWPEGASIERALRR